MQAIRISRQGELIDFDQNTQNSVPVVKDGDRLQNVWWLRFIDLEEARNMEGAKPVKIKALSFTADKSKRSSWINIPYGKHVQGCLIKTDRPGGNLDVYGVLEDGIPRLV